MRRPHVYERSAPRQTRPAYDATAQPRHERAAPRDRDGDAVTRQLIGSLVEHAIEAHEKGMAPAVRAERALLEHLGLMPPKAI